MRTLPLGHFKTFRGTCSAENLKTHGARDLKGRRTLEGSAYVIGGFGMTALGSGKIIVVPIRSGVGLRLGANIGYLKFTPQATWNPF
jgi:hypothetical protein